MLCSNYSSKGQSAVCKARGKENYGRRIVFGLEVEDLFTELRHGVLESLLIKAHTNRYDVKDSKLQLGVI